MWDLNLDWYIIIYYIYIIFKSVEVEILLQCIYIVNNIIITY